MLKSIMEQVYNTEDQKGNVDREMKILRENTKEMLQIKNTVTELSHHIRFERKR